MYMSTEEEEEEEEVHGRAQGALQEEESVCVLRLCVAIRAARAANRAEHGTRP